MQKFFLFFVKKLLTKFLSHSIISNVSGTRQNTKQYARVAQLVEHDLAKVGVAGSSPVFRSLARGCSSGGIGRHAGLKILWPLRPCGFNSRLEYN